MRFLPRLQRGMGKEPSRRERSDAGLRCRLLPAPVPLLAALTIGWQAIAHPTVLDAGARRRAGVAVATLHAVRVAAKVASLGTVLDPAPLLRLAGRIATDESQVAENKAKVVLERQQMAQASALYGSKTTSLATYQKAQEDLAANQAALAVARTKRQALLAQTEATWGSAMGAALRSDGDPLPQLAAGTAVLVGLSLPPGRALKAPPQTAEGEAAGTRFALRLIGPVPGMLGRYPGQSLLYQSQSLPAVPIGATVSAALAAGPVREGVLVPGSAVLWRNGQAVVFRTRPRHRFAPVPISTATPVNGGYFVSAHLSPGDRVVVHGADILLGLGKAVKQKD